MDEKIKKELEETVGELVSKMGFSMSEVKAVECEENDQKTIICDIKTEESNFLIGQYGVNLQSLQHIARLVVRKKIAEKINFVLDVNSYRQERTDSVIKMARNMAEEAITGRRAIILRPMSPYERRIVHLELCKNDKIKTESIGEGEDRCVVIKPAELI